MAHDTDDRMNDLHLEPRVAKLETGLEMLTRDVASLAQIVRDQGSSIERQIKELAVGVTQAAAPKRTDWQTLISAVFLVMAIGSAVFVPLTQRLTTLEETTRALSVQHEAHEHLVAHPLAELKLNNLSSLLNDHVRNNVVMVQVPLPQGVPATVVPVK
jgi:hypothetical protein